MPGGRGKRKSKEERILQGTFRNDRDYDRIDAEQPRIKLPAPSALLGETALKMYYELGGKLEQQGLLRTDIDIQYLELYCLNFEISVTCEVAIEKAGGLAKYMKTHPKKDATELQALMKSRDNMKGLLGSIKLGKVIKDDKKDEETDPMKKLLMR